MKILKYTEFMNEGVIIPGQDIVERAESIIKGGEWSTIEELNGLLSPHLRFMHVIEFRDSLKTEVEKRGVPMYAPLFAAFHMYLKIPVILYNMPEARLIGEIRGRGLSQILTMIDHEMVHQGQDYRSGGKSVSFERSPVNNEEKYFSHYTELMAYARTLAKSIADSGIKKEKAMQMARSGEIYHWIWSKYMGIGGDVFRRFKKYFFQYLEDGSI